MNSFSVDRYASMLRAIKEAGYLFRKFTDYSARDREIPAVILRHDIDISIHDAVQIATLENAHDVSATYFFSLHSPLYNLITSRAQEALRLMHEQGHEIALQVDLDLEDESYADRLLNDLDLLVAFYPFASRQIVSIHRPGNVAHKLADVLLADNVRHTYERQYFTDIPYFSDSRGSWRHGSPLESRAFEEQLSMQILTHPVWWIEDGARPIEKIESFLRSARERTIDALESTTLSFSLAELRSSRSQINSVVREPIISQSEYKSGPEEV